MMVRRILVPCPDEPIPTGGIKQLYRHVDVLCRLGFSAQIVHRQPGFRCRWFENSTPIVAAASLEVSKDDVILLPEIYARRSLQVFPQAKKVIFNQGCYLTFSEEALNRPDLEIDYRHPNVLATIVASEDAQRYVSFAFPGHRVFRVRYGFDCERFRPLPNKNPQIAFMPRRSPHDLGQIISLLRARGTLKSYDLVAVDNMTEAQVASVLGESRIFLSAARQEGFGMPVAEAMASGCIVIGYPGGGSSELLHPDRAYPVPESDIVTFVETIEHVLATWEQDPSSLEAQAQQASQWMRESYSLAQETESIATCWQAILGS